MLKFLPEAVRKACTRDSPLRELPFIESDAEGAAAVIDISGFTILTTNLLKLHGADGAAKLRDAIDGVFDVIIRTIYRWGGSIVKFAGDAALASWSSTPDSGQLHLVKAYLCCLELLREFRDNCSALNEDIGIHIGLASGAVHHIHLGGSAANDRGTSQNRREYLIAGQAVIEAARLLDLGHRGDLLMSIEMKKCLEEVFVVPPWPSLFPRPKVVSNQWVYLLKEDDTQIPDILRSWSGIPFPELPNYQEEELDENFALTYIETSVRKHLFDNHGLHSLMVPPSSTTLTQESTCRSANYITAPPSRLSSTKVSSETYSDMRSVSIAFFRFPDVHFDGDPEFDKEWSQSLGTISESQEEGSSTRGSIRYSSVHRCLHHAQHIVEVLMRSVTSQGGTVRQINYDDKAFTILAVWGLRGLAHHRAETRYTLAACMEVARKLTGQGFGSAQIGVSTGTVYTGLFGNELRMDGTVLGAPVNLAARLMCLDGVAVGLLRKIGEISIFCDDSTQLSGSEWFSFMEAPIPAKLKGFSEALMVYLVVGEKSSSEQSENIQVVGRTEELKLLKDTISSWRMKSQRHTLFITGRSGFGKSTLIKTAMQMLDSTCVGDEMKQRTSLGVLDKLVRGLLHKMRSVNLEAINFKQIRARQTDAGSRAGSHLWSRVGSRGGSRLSLIQQDRDWSYLNDILEALCVSKAGIATIAAIPGLRKIDNSDFVPSDGEISVRLSIVLATLINGLYSIGYSVCLVWDDIQWFDRETLKTLLALIQYCPHALFLIVGRTRNARRFRSSSFTKRIPNGAPPIGYRRRPRNGGCKS
ncbi:hypothetical protein DFJ73DRAFT_220170 [Zopfochytrium polystomum]|nr:hypothetical protein DFJ73DRAFT_220170 [Zopfochytrium polystomum]